MAYGEQAIWELLLSHHPPEHLHRTLRLRLGRHSVRVCTRCFGALVGFGIVLCTVLTPFDMTPAGPATTFLLVAAGAALGMLDFYCQLVRARESTNTRRAATGLLFGSAAAVSLLAGVHIHPLLVFELPALVMLYTVFLLANATSRNCLVSHLSRYATYCECCVFPQIRPGRHEMSARRPAPANPSEAHHECRS